MHSVLSIVFYTADCLPIVLGIVPNMWLLLAALTSKDIRSRMRNKIICSISVLHLLNCLLLTPMRLEVKHLESILVPVNCYLLIAVNMMALMDDFITNWSLVTLVAVFLAQTCGCRPRARFSSPMVVVGTWAVVVMPWVASLIAVPAITASSYYSFWERHNITAFRDSCYFSIPEAFLIIKSIDTVVALLIAVALLVTAAVQRRRRFARGPPSGARVELIDREPEVDEHYGYTAAVMLTIVCDITDALFLELIDFKLFPRLIFSATSYFLSQSKVFLGPLPWLLFPDIRERIRTWRPWHCTRPGNDTTIVLGHVQTE